MLELLTRRADEHIPHEKGMIGTGANDTNANTILLIPASIAVHDVDAISGVEIIDSSLSVDFPDLVIVSIKLFIEAERPEKCDEENRNKVMCLGTSHSKCAFWKATSSLADSQL